MHAKIVLITALAGMASIATAAPAIDVRDVTPDPAGAKNKGNGAGKQFITGACESDADCASNCCAAQSSGAQATCSGPGAAFQNGKMGCGSAGKGKASAPAAPPVSAPATGGGAPAGGVTPDPAGAKNKGNGAGKQFISGACDSDADCASKCCAGQSNGGQPVCSGPGAAFQNGKMGCGSAGKAGGSSAPAAPPVMVAPGSAPVTPPVSAPAGGSSSSGGGVQAKDVYVVYNGDGSEQAGWPGESKWATFDSLWNINLPFIQKACTNNAQKGADNSAAETDAIKSALQSVAKEVGLDPRIGLAIMMQESKGCVRIHATLSPPPDLIPNPGLMQSHDGATCEGVSPCPPATIAQMIKDGLGGTPKGDGMVQTIAQAKKELGASGAQAVYGGARVYNSGRVQKGDLNNGFTATHCYAMDVANRLTGWIASETKCKNT
ncbi:hypothetical protein VHEMI04530 [[Torrubiella] hemipterigena]|uniref:Uncharacterized protein n=1 Tax=[Torrubiella] hemipterigena TaxID=1531966 RepID=A0A0A1SVJ4_9HYPO|nr:hypothetical protein VHEMI04530 [[Torrubiella] hemipterigena]